MRDGTGRDSWIGIPRRRQTPAVQPLAPARREPEPPAEPEEMLADGEVDREASVEEQCRICHCPNCHKAHPRVTRTVQFAEHIKREHRCPRCAHAWTTVVRRFGD